MAEVFTEKEIAARYRVHIRTVKNWITAGRLPHLKIGRSVRITEKHLEQFEKAYTKNPKK